MIYNPGTMSGAASTAPGALSVDGRQPVWMTLGEARERAFTGEVVFEIDPEVLAYFDNGVVYYAERATDVSLGQRLLDAGVIELDQLARGTVRVGGVEHLGRLFERDGSVDRDAVLVVTETSTEELIADLANREIASVRVTAYRHHPSGVHRWFVAPREQVGATRPVSDVPQLGASAVDDLPGELELSDDDLIIEWDEPFDDVVRDEVLGTAIEFEADPHTESVVADAATDFDVVDDATDFAFVWPDGSEDLAMPTLADPTLGPQQDLSDDTMVIEPIGESDGDTAGTVMTRIVPRPTRTPFSVTPEGGLRFEMPALDLREEPEEDTTEVPDEVAEAVRRAIAAIESATSEVPVITANMAPPADIVVNEPAAFAGFAPPTMDMRAEVLYEQAEAALAAEQRDVSPMLVEVEAEAVPALLVAGTVPSNDGGDERTSALRRLIGSLRRKDR